MSILVIEDDPVTLRIICGYLANNHYEPLMANSVREAKRLLETNSDIEMIICDIIMPEADGFDFLKFKRSFLKFKDIPVLMCSSLNDKESVTKSIALGASDHLVKPFKSEVLIKKVKKLLSSRKNTILIVDDEEIVLKVLERTIQREGYSIISATSVKSALKILESHEIIMVITDIVMPEMDGFELLKMIKEKNPQIPVLMITGHSGKYNKKDIITAGADGFITKPFRNMEILGKIENILNLQLNKG